MIAAQVTDCIGDNKRCVRSALREACRTTEVKANTADGNLRNADRLVDADINAQSRGVGLMVRRKRDVEAIETKAYFVGQLRAKAVRFVESENLTAGLACIAETGNCVAL